MDKPRHPQVIRPWKTQETQKTKWNTPRTEPRPNQRGKKPSNPRHG
jgi:hypothetical protein